MIELKFKIANMTCVNCSNAIEKVCSKIDGVENVSVSYLNSSGVFLVANENLKDKIKTKIKALGFEILEDEENLQLYKILQLKKLRNTLFLSVILSAIIMYFEMFIKGAFSSFIQLSLSYIYSDFLTVRTCLRFKMINNIFM